LAHLLSLSKPDLTETIKKRFDAEGDGEGKPRGWDKGQKSGWETDSPPGFEMRQQEKGMEKARDATERAEEMKREAGQHEGEMQRESLERDKEIE
jgi:hypothetical protein